MNFTLAKQHYHHAAMMAFFWGKNKEYDREENVFVVKWEEYISKLIAQGNKKKIPILNMTQIKAEKIMSSRLIFKETEKILKFKEIEESFNNICLKLSEYYENNNADTLLKYLCNEEENEYVIKYFCMQLLRNPNNYVEYLNKFYIELYYNKKYFNPYLCNLFDINNIQKFMLFTNDIMIEDYYDKINEFSKYSFQLIRNPKKDNILTDNTIIKLNNNGYFKLIFKDDFDSISEILDSTYIITINNEFSLLFFKEKFINFLDKITSLYIEHQLNICLLYSRNFLICMDQKEYFEDKIKKFINQNNEKQMYYFLKYYIDMNFTISSIENQFDYFNGIYDLKRKIE